MANTYSQMHIQVVFAVKFREALIHASWEEELYRYITAIVQANGQKMLAINGMPDHIHFLIGLRPECRLSDLVREVKKSSNAFIKEKRLKRHTFRWQEGFVTSSHRRSTLDIIIK